MLFYQVQLKGQTSRVRVALRYFLRTSDNGDRICVLISLAFFLTRSLEQLLVSLQWGRQQTYYPSAQPLSTGDLAAANYKLADAINSHLLGNTTSSSVVKSSSAAAEQLCSTPAEKMAEKVLTLSFNKREPRLIFVSNITGS